MDQHMQAAAALYQHLSTKMGKSYEITESSYKQLNSCFMAIAS